MHGQFRNLAFGIHTLNGLCGGAIARPCNPNEIYSWICAKFFENLSLRAFAQCDLIGHLGLGNYIRKLQFLFAQEGQKAHAINAAKRASG